MSIEQTTQPTVRRGVHWLLVILLLAGATAGGIALQRYLPALQPEDPELTKRLNGLGSGTLAQSLAELKVNPDNQALREKIVRTVAASAVKPEIPAQARDAHSRAQDLFIRAQTIDDVGRAIDEYQAALLIAPWWPRANRDLALALEMAQQRREAIAALRLYLIAAPTAADTRVLQDRIRKIEADLRRADTPKRNAPVSCEVLVPRLVDPYWVYLDGRLVSTSSRDKKKYHLIRMNMSKGTLFMDSAGKAARVSSRGIVTYVRRGAQDKVYARKTFFIEPGNHRLELLLLNASGLPFALRVKDITVQPGSTQKFSLDMPAKHVIYDAPVRAVAIPWNKSWQEIFSGKQSELKATISGFASDPVARTLHQALVGLRLSPPGRSTVTVNLSSSFGGRRELDARLVDAMIEYLKREYRVDSWFLTAYHKSSDYRAALAGLRPVVEAHNQRIEALKEISKLLK
jgi:hypothetical protein